MATIKEKIQKLLALASSPNEFEAKAALLKAKELMAKNKLTEADLEEAKKQEFKHLMCEDISWTTDSGRVWMANLCEMICNNYLCTAAWYTPEKTRTHTLVISGMSEDLEVCKEVMGYVIKFVENTIDGLCRRYRRMDPKSVASSYATGFITGMDIAFEEQKQENPGWALVVVKSEEVKKYEDRLSNRTVKTKKSDVNPMVYLQGVTDGHRFNDRKAIKEDQDDQA